MPSYQFRVAHFVIECFGRAIASDTVERNHRFLEEALELVQALGCTPADAHMLVDYVFGRPLGDSHQECGGVMVTLAALATAAALDMDKAGEDELARVWKKIDVIREKQKAKPRGSPLPSHEVVSDLAITDDLAKFWAQMPEGATDSLKASGAKQLAQAYLDAKDDCLRLHREKMDALYGPDGFPRSSIAPSDWYSEHSEDDLRRKHKEATTGEDVPDHMRGESFEKWADAEGYVRAPRSATLTPDPEVVALAKKLKGKSVRQPVFVTNQLADEIIRLSDGSGERKP